MGHMGVVRKEGSGQQHPGAAERKRGGRDYEIHLSTPSKPVSDLTRIFFHTRKLIHVHVQVSFLRRGGGGGQGRTQGEGPVARPPLGPEKHYIFRVSSVKLRDLHL